MAEVMSRAERGDGERGLASAIPVRRVAGSILGNQFDCVARRDVSASSLAGSAREGEPNAGRRDDCVGALTGRVSGSR